MDELTPQELAVIGHAVAAARVQRTWGKEEAARAAEISSITWKRVEDGHRVQDIKLRAVERALGWPYGSLTKIGRGELHAPGDPQVDTTDLIEVAIRADSGLSEDGRRLMLAMLRELRSTQSGMNSVTSTLTWLGPPSQQDIDEIPDPEPEQQRQDASSME